MRFCKQDYHKKFNTLRKKESSKVILRKPEVILKNMKDFLGKSEAI